MLPLWLTLLGAGGLTFLILRVLTRVDHRKTWPIWREAVEATGLKWTRHDVSGVRRGLSIRVARLRESHSGIDGLSVSVEIASKEVRLAPITVGPKGVQRRLSALAQSEAEGHTGDEAFDEAVWISGPAPLLAALMDEETREQVGLLVQLGHLEMEHGRLRLKITGRPSTSNSPTGAIAAITARLGPAGRGG